MQVWSGGLFSHAEVGEDGVEYFVGGDGFAGDFGEVVEGFPQVLAE